MTNKQKQCLLCYLGHYTGKIDSDFGPASKQATKDFQTAYGLEPDGVFGPATEAMILKAVAGEVKPRNFWDNVKHFKREEMRCKCGGKYCNGFPAEPEEKLIRAADRVREHFDVPVTVTSGVRCEQHNANVGGVSGSRHKLGKAMDFRVSGQPASIVLPYVQAQPEIRYAYAIDSSHIHMDVQ